ncbi:NnrS family protein [Puniceicoccus vermicola]|uniref:NnrS family protein n=1 Tax=Puniceicoccus vermicola TaxID=388746 RepID=A0A7X1E7B4_9BACT|nr:NnrS family protein [Puniceicoccus vermicola]MBC2603547.1 NnrS family protein [Puniceicoccus vermicola]
MLSSFPSRNRQPVEETASPKRYWKLVAAGEPYRLLFPVGTLVGILGVSLWPAYVWGQIDFYPGTIHSRIMIQGFLTCFIIGFLGTAFPRLLGVRRFQLEETLSWTTALVAGSLCHIFGSLTWGDFLFTLSLLLLLGSLFVRFRKRQDTPPPGFILVLLGLSCAWVGGILLLFEPITPETISQSWFVFAKLALNQGYLLLPVMGIGAFLIPRFFGLPNRQNFPESLALPKGWIPRAAFALFCGILVIASFLLETLHYDRSGFGLRAFAVFLYFARELPLHRAQLRQGALALAMRLSLLSIPLGYLLMAIWPQWQGALIHVVFISGFSLLTFTVASRVVLGHGGSSHLFKAKLVSIYGVTGLLVLAMLTRVSADWMPHIRNSHLGYAALAWIVGTVIWLMRFSPLLRREDKEE